jgi:pimeloyl-ACP methyl ester carboxylesterase
MEAFILVHGKGSGPSATKCALNALHDRLKSESYIVDYVDYPWAKSREYDLKFEDSVIEVEQAINRVQAKGATRINLVGHSLGANLLLYYATLRNDFDNLILLCPAHNTHLDRFKFMVSWSLDHAAEQLRIGNDVPQPYVDYQFRKIEVHYFKPSMYQSYFDSVRGKCNMAINARNMIPGINLLVVIGAADVSTETTEDTVFTPAVKTPQSKIITIPDGTHENVPGKVFDNISDWIKTL